MKKIIFGILLHVVAKMVNIQQMLWRIQENTCDGIIEPYDEKTKAVPTNFTEKK